MTPSPDVVALQAALDAGPTPGPRKLQQESIDPEWHIVTVAGGRITANVHIETGNAMDAANAQLIVACAPDRITRVLAALRAAEQRAEAAEADAARYRWMRVGGNGIGWGSVFDDCRDLLDGDSLDAAIDAALKQGEQPS